MAEYHVRSYPTRVQALAFIDGVKHSGVGWGDRLQVRDNHDRHSPSGYWFHVVEVHEEEVLVCPT